MSRYSTAVTRARTVLQEIPDKLKIIDERQDEYSKLYQLKPRKLPPMARTRDLLHIYGIKARKHLSQNFLLQSELIRRLVRSAGVTPGCRVIEIGPGPGNLTRAILEQSPLEVLAVEKDRRFLPLLEQLADAVLPGQLKVLLGDAEDHDFDNIFGDPTELIKRYKLPEDLPDYVFRFTQSWDSKKVPHVRLIGNLPFSVATALLVKWLSLVSQHRGFWQYGRVPMLLTFQEEVARRICADVGSFERSRLSAMASNYCHTDYQFTIKGSSFTPAARVDTGVVRLTPRVQPYSNVPFKLFEKVVRHIFHHRNHSLDFNFRTLYPRDMHDYAEQCFDQARVNSKLRPYMLSSGELARLCDRYYQDCEKWPSLIEFNYRVNKKLLSDHELKVTLEAGLGLLQDFEIASKAEHGAISQQALESLLRPGMTIPGDNVNDSSHPDNIGHQ